MTNTVNTPVPRELTPDTVAVRDLIATLFKALVDHEDQVDVVTIAGTRNVIFEVSVHPDDIPFAVGKAGAHADAVRTIVQAACKKHSIKYELEVLGKR